MKEKLRLVDLLEALEENNVGFVEEMEYNYNRVKEMYTYSLGDGNECGKTFYIEDFDMYVNLEGSYSSWEGTEWTECYEAVPYEFKETRYKRKEEE